jgi:hypothetical protein
LVKPRECAILRLTLRNRTTDGAAEKTSLTAENAESAENIRKISAFSACSAVK